MLKGVLLAIALGMSVTSSPSMASTPSDGLRTAEVPCSRGIPCPTGIVPGDGAVTVTWTPAETAILCPNCSGGFTSYLVQSSFDPVTGSGYKRCQTFAIEATSCTVTGLVNGVNYTFTVKAGYGGQWAGGFWEYFGPQSPVATAPVAPCCGVPAGPVDVVVTPSGGGVSVGWAQSPDWGGAQAIGYTATASPGGASCTTENLSCELEGLTYGQEYSVGVVATNRKGASVPVLSAAPVMVPLAAPMPPAGGKVAYLGSGTARVSWGPSPRDGGAPVKGYEVTSIPAGHSCRSARARACIVEGLRGGREYAFTVTAVNQVGASAASEPIVAGKLTGPASVPKAVESKAGDTFVDVAWLPPKDTGGGRVLQYVVKAAGGATACQTRQLSCRISGLQPGSRHAWSIYAVNTSGRGSAASTGDVQWVT